MASSRVLLCLVCVALRLLPLTQANVHFTDVADAVGLRYLERTVAAPQPREILNVFPFIQEVAILSGAAAVGDYDDDGDLDLFVTQVDSTGVLYENVNGSFVDMSHRLNTPKRAATVTGIPTDMYGQTCGAAWLDIDNDGDLDLLVGSCSVDPENGNFVYINDGQGNFTEEAEARGLAMTEYKLIGAPFAVFGVSGHDINRDGLIDLAWGQWAPHPSSYPRLPRHHWSRVFLNQPSQPGFFVDASASMLPDYLAWAFSPAFADMDRNGWPDMVVAADFRSSRMLNSTELGFVDVTDLVKVGLDENGMGSALADWNHDGYLDWIVTAIFDPHSTCAFQSCNWGFSGNRAYTNLAGGTAYGEDTDLLGVRDNAWGWGVALFDADNDGDADMAMTNGARFPQLVSERFWEVPSRLFLNEGPLNYPMRNVSASAGITETNDGKGLIAFDYDNDGDLDIFIANTHDRPLLYRNDGDVVPRDYVRVRTHGTITNSFGIGARVYVCRAGAPLQYHEMGASSSHFCGHSASAPAHFGLNTTGGSTPSGVHVVVYWPVSNRTQAWRDVTLRETLHARENDTVALAEAAGCATAEDCWARYSCLPAPPRVRITLAPVHLTAGQPARMLHVVVEDALTGAASDLTVDDLVVTRTLLRTPDSVPLPFVAVHSSDSGSLVWDSNEPAAVGFNVTLTAFASGWFDVRLRAAAIRNALGYRSTNSEQSVALTSVPIAARGLNVTLEGLTNATAGSTHQFTIVVESELLPVLIRQPNWTLHSLMLTQPLYYDIELTAPLPLTWPTSVVNVAYGTTVSLQEGLRLETPVTISLLEPSVVFVALNESHMRRVFDNAQGMGVDAVDTSQASFVLYSNDTQVSSALAQAPVLTLVERLEGNMTVSLAWNSSFGAHTPTADALTLTGDVVLRHISVRTPGFVFLFHLSTSTNFTVAVAAGALSDISGRSNTVPSTPLFLVVQPTMSDDTSSSSSSLSSAPIAGILVAAFLLCILIMFVVAHLRRKREDDDVSDA